MKRLLYIVRARLRWYVSRREVVKCRPTYNMWDCANAGVGELQRIKRQVRIISNTGFKIMSYWCVDGRPNVSFTPSRVMNSWVMPLTPDKNTANQVLGIMTYHYLFGKLTLCNQNSSKLYHQRTVSINRSRHHQCQWSFQNSGSTLMQGSMFTVTPVPPRETVLGSLTLIGYFSYWTYLHSVNDKLGVDIDMSSRVISPSMLFASSLSREWNDCFVVFLSYTEPTLTFTHLETYLRGETSQIGLHIKH